MKKTLTMTFVYFLFMLSAVFGIICTIFELSILFRLLTVAMVVVSATAVLTLARCPYCGKYGIRIQPFLKQNPRCKKCGKEIPYRK